MLTWNKKVQKNQAGRLLSESYKAQVPHWGEASIHPHIHHPGEIFLDCPALGINMHPLAGCSNGRIETRGGGADADAGTACGLVRGGYGRHRKYGGGDQVI